MLQHIAISQIGIIKEAHPFMQKKKPGLRISLASLWGNID